MGKVSVDIRLAAGFIGLDAKESSLVEFEGDQIVSRVVGFVDHVFDVAPGMRGSRLFADDGSWTGSARLHSMDGRYPELEVRIADAPSDTRDAMTPEDFEKSVQALRTRYEDATWAHVAPGPVVYKTATEIRSHPFNILVQRHGAIYVRYGWSRLEADVDAHMEVIGPVIDEDGETVVEADVVFHPEALTRTSEQTYGGSRCGYHHVPAGRFFAENVDRRGCGFYDLDAIDDVVSRIRAVWGDLDAQMNIPATCLYRSSLLAKKAA